MNNKQMKWSRAPWLLWRTPSAMLLMPFLMLFVLFTVIPLLYSFWLALHRSWGPEQQYFVGFDNFVSLLRDPVFWLSARNTLSFTGLALLQVPLALWLAYLADQPSIRGRTLWKLMIFSPTLVGSAFVAVIFGTIFEPHAGLLNVSLHHLWGFNLEFPWLERYVMTTLIAAHFWMNTGFFFVFLLAALQSRRRDLEDAAALDGAGAWQRFRHVTWPAIDRVAVFLTIISLTHALQIFDLAYIMHPGGGSEQRALTLVYYLYQLGFETGDLGYAGALGWIVAGIVAATIAAIRLSLNVSRISHRRTTSIRPVRAVGSMDASS